MRSLFCLYVFLQLMANAGRSYNNWQFTFRVIIDLTNVVLALFMFWRQSWILLYSFIVLPLGSICRFVLDCWRDQRETMSKCVQDDVEYIMLIVGPFITCLVYLTVAYKMNFYKMQKKYLPSLCEYRYMWQCEKNRVQGKGMLEALDSCTDAIIEELQRQRSVAWRKLSVANRISAWLTLETGRVCLRQSIPKALQPHRDIDFLFLLATEVCATCVCRDVWVACLYMHRRCALACI